MAKAVLARVAAPTLLIVGERDETVVGWNRESFAELRCEKRLEIVPAATHLFEESGTLEEVAQLAAEWFRRWLRARCQLTSQHAEMFNRRGTAGKPVTLAGKVELHKGRPKIVIYRQCRSQNCEQTFVKVCCKRNALCAGSR